MTTCRIRPSCSPGAEQGVELTDLRDHSAIEGTWRSSSDLAEKALRATIEIREATYDVLAPRAAGVTVAPDGVKRGAGTAYRSQFDVALVGGCGSLDVDPADR